MARWAPARSDVIREYAEEVLGLFPTGRILVGVGGLDRGTRDGFAAELAGALEGLGVASTALSLDDFVGDLSGASPSARVRDAYDVAAFRSTALNPYRRGETFAVNTQTPNGWKTSGFDPGERAVLVVTGAFVHRSDLVGIWHASAWLQVSRTVAREREAQRLGVPVDDAALAAEFAAIDDFFQHVDPRKIANASFDVTDVEHPRRVFADAC